MKHLATDVTAVAPNKFGLLRRLETAFAELNKPIADSNTFDLCGIVTLVLLFLYAGTHWYLTIPMRALTLCAVFIPKLRADPRLWFAALTLLVCANYYDRYLIDNHKYLLTYWVLAFLLASLQSDPAERDRILRFNGRMLIGLCFLLAVFAKVISLDFPSGGFFRHTLLMDGRFTTFAWLVGGLDRGILSEMKAAYADIRSAYLLGVDIRHIDLASTFRFSVVVTLMTYWTILIETSVALTFLWPSEAAIFEWGRRYLLWIFIGTTYSVALVSGFAWTLTAMGLAQLPEDKVRYRVVYILFVAVLLQFYEMHFVNLAIGAINYFTHQNIAS